MAGPKRARSSPTEHAGLTEVKRDKWGPESPCPGTPVTASSAGSGLQLAEGGARRAGAAGVEYAHHLAVGHLAERRDGAPIAQLAEAAGGVADHAALLRLEVGEVGGDEIDALGVIEAAQRFHCRPPTLVALPVGGGLRERLHGGLAGEHEELLRLGGARGAEIVGEVSYAVYSRTSPEQRVNHEVIHPVFRWRA